MKNKTMMIRMSALGAVGTLVPDLPPFGHMT